MSKEDSGKGGFEVLALSNAKSKGDTKKKAGGLNDLFKCVESLASSTESLRDYAMSEISDSEKATIEKYLGGLTRIQDGLLEMAQNRVRDLGKIPTQLDGMIDMGDSGRVEKI